jgi:hypothetical protein
VDQDRNRDRGRPEPGHAEYQVSGEDHERHEHQRVERDRHAVTAEQYRSAAPGTQVVPGGDHPPLKRQYRVIEDFADRVMARL